MNFYDVIKGKSICFVGGSPILKGKELGPFIDYFDLVIRTNGSINLIEQKEYVHDYGKRTDILYTNNQFYREMSPLPILEYIDKGVKWLCMKTCKEDDKEEFNKVINCRKITSVMKTVNFFLPSATMGAYILTDLLACDPKELYVTGIDFFANKKAKFEHNNYQEYLPGYLPDKIRRQGNIINKGKNEDGHNFKENASYIYSLYCKHDNLIFPDFILSILEGIINGEVTQK